MSKWGSSLFMIKLLLNIVVLALGNVTSNELQGFYFIQQWLPSYCNQLGTKCCYPSTGKIAAEFTICGLWPHQNDGSSLEKCPGASFDVAPIKPIESLLQKEWTTLTCPQIGRKFWLHEWNKHGTCSKSVLDEMAYFRATLNLKSKINICQALAKAKILPNNQYYSVESMRQAISQATGISPVIFCNHDALGNYQIWQIVHCVDKSGTKLVNCSNVPKGQGHCASTIKFPST